MAGLSQCEMILVLTSRDPVVLCYRIWMNNIYYQVHRQYRQNYSCLCLNPYLSVDTKKYGLLQSMGFGRACPRPLFLVIHYVWDDYVRLNATNWGKNKQFSFLMTPAGIPKVEAHWNDLKFMSTYTLLQDPARVMPLEHLNGLICWCHMRIVIWHQWLRPTSDSKFLLSQRFTAIICEKWFDHTFWHTYLPYLAEWYIIWPKFDIDSIENPYIICKLTKECPFMELFHDHLWVMAHQKVWVTGYGRDWFIWQGTNLVDT